MTSDWGATHSARCLNAGLDVEMIDGPDSSGYQEPAFLGAEAAALPPTTNPHGEAMGDIYGGRIPEEPEPPPTQDSDAGSKVDAQTIDQALRSEWLTEAAVTRAAGHVLYEMQRFGCLDRRSKRTFTAHALEANTRINVYRGIFLTAF